MPSRIRAVPRLALVALAAIVLSGIVGSVAFSADPGSGTVSIDTPRAQWQGKKFDAGTNTVQGRRACATVSPGKCDNYTLTVAIDPEHWETNKGGAEIGIQWESAEDNFDLFVTNESGTSVIASSAQEGTTSERVVIDEANAEDGPYKVVVNGFDVRQDATYSGGVLVASRAIVPAGEVPSEPLSGVKCENGLAGPFPCKDVDLESFLPISELVTGVEDPEGVNLNDIWGWTDPQTGREYALIGKTTGTAFVDITDAKDPKYLGTLPSAPSVPGANQNVSTIFKVWRDIKVYKDHAYVVSEEPAHGMQVFDLTRLRDADPDDPGRFTADANYTRTGTNPNPRAFGNAHNIAINEDSGFAYVIGTGTCEGGPHMVDISEPKAPKFAGCADDGDGYTHDSQCVNYTGPDESAKGKEICFNSNEDSLTIVDVTDKDAPKQLGKTGYDGSAYSHQGWLTADGRHFLLNDELDEQGSGEPTTTRIFDVSRLDQPRLTGKYAAKVNSIDHNLYTLGSLTYEANYRSGLRILDHSGVADGKLEEKGFFDVFPADDDAEFNGAWSNFPYYKSGVVVVSGIEEGLFVVRPRNEAAQPDQREQQTATATTPSTPAAASAAPAAKAATPAATGPGATACAATAGFRSVSAKRSGRSGLALGFDRARTAPVTVDVFRQSVGRRVTGEKLVARFTDRSGTVRWNGKANRRGAKVGDGAYFVRYRMGRDVRRITLRREAGRFVTRPDFYRRATCDLLPSYKLSRPVFGGSGGRALGIAYRVSAQATVSVVVTRGSRTVRRFSSRRAAPNRTQRLNLSARGLPRGDYRVRITVKRGSQLLRSSLVSRKL